MREPRGPDYYDRAYFDNPTSGKGYPGLYTERCAPWWAVAAVLVCYCKARFVVDFGAAKGFVLKALTELGVEGVGYDFSPYAVEHAVAPVLLQDITDPEFEPRGADVVVLMDVLEHFDDRGISATLANAAKTHADWLYAHCGVATPDKYDEGKEEHITILSRAGWISRVREFGWVLSSETDSIIERYRKLGEVGCFWADRVFLFRRPEPN